MKKDISIIIPVYNGEEYIRECLDSIIIQNPKNIEVIVIDDGSKDNSYKIINDYSKKYDYIKVYHQKNSGVSVARNNGLKKSSGKYICFMDCDDTISKNYFKTISKNIKNYEMLTFNWNTWYMDYKELSGIDSDMLLDKKEALRISCNSTNSFQGYLWNKVFLNKIIKENNLLFDENISVCEDLLFVVKYLDYCKNINSIKKSLYNYRMRKSSASKKFNIDKFKSMFTSYDEIIKICENSGIDNPVGVLYEYLFNYFLYKKIFNENNVYLNEEILSKYKILMHSKELSFKKKKDLFMVRRFLYPHKIYNRILGRFKKNHVMFN